MHRPLSPEELEQLRAIFRAWALNRAFVPDEALVSSLLRKGLVHAHGTGMRLTSAGLVQVRKAERN
ncbi:MAG TPA: hypothetical protein VFB08_02075 [Burkholderiales bacterium]|nr:hypothetical protein [Burkholderiales bacterium]